MSRYHRRWLGVPAGVLLLLACQAEQLTTPQPPAQPPAGLGATAIRVEVNLQANTVRVLSFADQAGSGPGIEAALLGTNEVTATTSNLTRSTPGQFTLNKVRVRFDVALTNRLTSASLVPATFPGGAAGTAGLLLFPFQVTQVTGGTVGQVDPSVDWSGDGSPLSGAPRNFFNDTGCPITGPRSDCFRWEQFPAPLGPGETTPRQGVGFDVKPSVQSFQVLLILAADISSDLPPVARLSVTPPSYIMNDGFPANFSAVAYDIRNNPLTWARLTWTTADITALEFQSGGSLVGAITGTSQVVHGRKVGPTYFTVSSGGVSVVVPVDIQVNTVALVQLNTPDSSITVEDQIQGDARVKDHSGNIIPGFLPTWSTTDPNVIMVDQNGLITATGPGTADVVATAGLQSGRVTITVSPKPSGSLTGTMRDLGGQPVAGALVHAVGPADVTATTGANGVYQFSTLPPGSYTFYLNANGCVPDRGSATVVVGQSQTLDFSLDCPPTVSGTLTATQGALPAGLTVELIRLFGPNIVGTVQSDGSYSISGFIAGGYSIFVYNLPGNCTTAGAGAIYFTQQAHLVKDWTVDCATGVSGTATDIHGFPVAGATVDLVQFVPAGPQQTTTTDGAGHYSFTSLSTAVYSVTISKGGACNQASGMATVLAGLMSTLDLTLDCPAVLQGKVVEPFGDPLPSGLTVELASSFQAPLTLPVISGLFGTSLQNAPPNVPSYTIRLLGVPASSCLITSPASGIVHILLNQQGFYQVDFTIDCRPATMVVTVDDGNGNPNPQPIIGALVVFQAQSGATVTGVTGQSGVTLTGLPLGGAAGVAATNLPSSCNSTTAYVNFTIVPGPNVPGFPPGAVAFHLAETCHVAGALEGTIQTALGNPLANIHVSVGPYTLLTDASGHWGVAGLPPGLTQVLRLDTRAGCAFPIPVTAAVAPKLTLQVNETVNCTGF